MSHYRSLFSSDLLTVEEHSCNACRAMGWSSERGGDPAHVLLVRRGSFTVRGRIEVFADPFSALVYDGAHSFRIARPFDGGDATTRIVPDEALMDEAMGRASIHVQVDQATHLKHLRLHARAKAPGSDRLDVEEAAVELLHALAGRSGTFDEPRPLPSTRRRIAQARAFLASAPEADHRLSDLAKAAGCSPYHFARLFKQETGCSVRAYRLRLRVALAIHHLAQGANDLTTIAMDTGFSHHSHMTATFQRALGKSPSAVRESLAASRTFLKAGLPRAA